MHCSYHSFHLLLHIFNNSQSKMGPADRLQYITIMLMFICVPSFLPQMYMLEKPHVLQPHPNICNHLWTETACHLSLGFSMHTTTDVILYFQKKQICFQANHITEHATVISSKSLTDSAASAVFHLVFLRSGREMLAQEYTSVCIQTASVFSCSLLDCPLK